jgi:hypothetical protein
MRQVRLLLFVLSIAFSSNVLSQTVYTTKTGEKYHKSNCKYLKYSKKEISIKRAKELGYTACKVCKPTSVNTKKKADGSSSSITTATKKKMPAKKATATQCAGKTQAGKRCKRKTKNANGRCYQHQ